MVQTSLGKDSQGCTAQHLAAEKGYADLMDLLILESADTNETNDRGRKS